MGRFYRFLSQFIKFQLHTEEVERYSCNGCDKCRKFQQDINKENNFLTYCGCSPVKHIKICSIVAVANTKIDKPNKCLNEDADYSFRLVKKIIVRENCLYMTVHDKGALVQKVNFTGQMFKFCFRTVVFFPWQQ